MNHPLLRTCIGSLIPRAGRLLLLTSFVAAGVLAFAQTQENPPGAPGDPGARRQTQGPGPGFGGGPQFGPRGRGPGGGGGPMGGVQARTKMLKQFDADHDGQLNLAERTAAREFLKKEREEGRGRRGPGFPGRRNNAQPVEAGPQLKPADVKSFPDAPLFDPDVVRTFFLEFDSPDWETELEEFYHTDVDLPAKLTVDGKTYEGVGVHFRGASSFFMVSKGRKRSLNLSLDAFHKGQNLGGYRTLNLLNSHTDPTFMRTVLYSHAAREYMAAPKANHVRLVVNGEGWGIYVNAQQFDKDFLRDAFGTTEGARWKVPGSPRGRGGLNDLGDDVEPYRRIYDLRTKDKPESWTALIRLCKTLSKTPPEQLKAALEPQLDIDGALRFLALENTLVNSDGYWVRSSDYNLYLDTKGRFHVIPHDANETFRPPEGPGTRGGGGGEPDPLTGSDDESKPLLSALLAVPELKARYLGFVREIATRWLDWNTLAPLTARLQGNIANDVRLDTHKLYAFEAFSKSLTEETEEQGFRGPESVVGMKQFAEKRRAFILGHPEIKKLGNP